jgi:hypothetical protein
MKTRVSISAKLEFRGIKYSVKGSIIRLSSGSFIVNERIKNNSCIDVVEDDILEDGFWSVALQLDNEYMLEIRFKYDFDNYTLTFEPLCSLVWLMDGGIQDEVQPIIKVTER